MTELFSMLYVEWTNVNTLSVSNTGEDPLFASSFGAPSMSTRSSQMEIELLLSGERISVEKLVDGLSRYATLYSECFSHSRNTSRYLLWTTVTENSFDHRRPE
jgi:hypothetical protein